MQKQFQGFIDLKMAYDAVPIPLLLQKLESRKVTMGVLSLIASLFLDCSSRVVVNGALSQPFQRQRGLFQGSVLSPFLFNIFINDLALQLDQSARWDPAPHSLLFADDIKIHHNTSHQFQKMLNQLLFHH